jgi:hypothetical protein
LHAQAGVGGVRARFRAAAGVGAEGAERLREVEPVLLRSAETLIASPQGASSFLTDQESRRCLAVGRLVELYETWCELDGADPARPEAARLAAAIAHWNRELERLRREDARAPLAVQ